MHPRLIKMVKGAEMGTCPRHHLHFHLLLHLWHRPGVAGVAGGPDACGHPASQEHRWQGRAAQLGSSGVAGAVAAGRSPRTGDAQSKALAGQEGAELRVLGRLCASMGAAGLWARRRPGLRGGGRVSAPSLRAHDVPRPNTLTARCGTRDRASAGDAPPAEGRPLRVTKQMPRLQDDKKAPGSYELKVYVCIPWGTSSSHDSLTPF